MRVALEWAGGRRWSAVGVHVSKQTEIFMYVGPRGCVRTPSRVPLLALCIYVPLHGCGMKNTAARKGVCILICTPVCECARAALFAR